MSVRITPALALAGMRRGIVALLLVALVLIVSFVPDIVRSDEPAALPAADTEQPAPRIANEVPTPSPGAVISAPAASRPASAPPPSLGSPVTPVHVVVHAPSVASAGEPFDAYVHIDAPSGLQRVQLAIAFDKKAMTLTDVSEGDLARRAGLPADFSTDEPSDGNLEVTFTFRNGVALTGAGTVAVLRFEPRKPGRVTINVPHLTAFDNAGAARFRADSPPPVSISIQ